MLEEVLKRCKVRKVSMSRCVWRKCSREIFDLVLKLGIEVEISRRVIGRPSFLDNLINKFNFAEQRD